MTAPTIKVELLAEQTGPAFGFTALVLDDSTDGQLDEEALGGPAEWVDITDDVRGVDIRRGNRTRDLDAFRASTAAVFLDNRLRQYDPTNTAADLYGNVVPTRQMRISATPDGGSEARLFTGIVESWDVNWVQNMDSVVVANLVDGLARLANQRMDAAAALGAGEGTGARVTRVLDLAEVDWDATARDIDTGLHTVGAFDGDDLASTYLQAVAFSEGGALFVARDGALTFRERLNAPTTPALHLTDDSSDTASVHYTDAQLASGSELLFNRIVLGGDDHSDTTSTDAVSQTAFGIRTLSRTTLLDTDTDAQTLADTLKVRFANPELRFSEVRVQVADHSSARQAELLGLELWDVVTLDRNPPGAGVPAVIDQTGRIDGLYWSFRPGNRAEVRIAMSAGEKQAWFIVGSADFGELDDDRVA